MKGNTALNFGIFVIKFTVFYINKRNNVLVLEFIELKFGKFLIGVRKVCFPNPRQDTAYSD